MPNLLQYTEIWTKILDQQVTQQATSGWMEANAGQVQYTGGKYVKVPTLSMRGWVTTSGALGRLTGVSTPKVRST